MKSYNRFIFVSIACYLLCVFILGSLFSNVNEHNDQAYRVDVNRIMQLVQHEDEFDELDISQYESITNIEFLSMNNNNQEDIRIFYNEDNENGIMIQPWYQQEELKGYVKFYYQIQKNNASFFYMAQGVLLILELIFILFLVYMKKRIIKPFHQLSVLPYELAKGHYKGEIHIQKSRYFKDYLWGMSQLKDTLDVSKKRQYDLMKEKKHLLLSLSHDIKTPLNLIKLYSKALDENLCYDEKSRVYAITQIEKKSEEIEHYVEKIITSAKEDIVDFDVKNDDFYLSDLLHQVLNVYIEQCRIRNIECRINTYKDRLLKGDIHRAQEVMENLFENALKYGDGQYIEVTFNEEEYHQLIHIRNSGNPLQPQELHHVFDSFFRGSNAQNVSGSGLGLYICKELMRKMDGAIYAQIYEDGMEFVLVFQ